MRVTSLANLVYQSYLELDEVPRAHGGTSPIQGRSSPSTPQRAPPVGCGVLLRNLLFTDHAGGQTLVLRISRLAIWGCKSMAAATRLA